MYFGAVYRPTRHSAPAAGKRDECCTLQFSHGDYAEHKGRLDQLRALSKELDVSIPAMLDTKGPEIRLGEFENGKEQLTAGQKFILTSRNVKGTKEISSITYKDLPHDVSVGGRIMLDDGLISLRIESITDTDIVCTVEMMV